MSPRRLCWRACTATWRNRAAPTIEALQAAARERAAEGWGNILAGIRRDADEEEFRTLLTRPGLRVERIVSTGQVSADWYDQSQDEWVLLVEGGAHLFVEGQGELVLGPGDHLLIPAHVRHRVTWTDPERPTIWLALHFPAAAG